jgi:hypothetical protein
LFPFGVSFEAAFKDQRCVCKELNLKTKIKVDLRINTLAPVLGSDFFEVAAGAVESVEVVVSLALEAPVVKTWRNQTPIKTTNIIRVTLLSHSSYLCLWESFVVERRIQPPMLAEAPHHYL